MSKFCAVLAVMFLAVASLAAQTPDTASMRGQVTDQTHAAVAGAEIKITSTLLGSERTTRTNAAGGFSFSGLPVGSYVITAHRANSLTSGAKSLCWAAQRLTSNCSSASPK